MPTDVLIVPIALKANRVIGYVIAYIADEHVIPVYVYIVPIVIPVPLLQFPDADVPVENRCNMPSPY
jgi:hypothetical protein